jgi:hypothetical protein
MPDDALEVPASGRFDAVSEYRAAIDRLVARGRRTIRIFDRNLEGAGFNDASRFEALRSFLLLSRDNRLRIVLHDVALVQRDCPRLLLLLRQFSDAVSIHQTNQEARGIYDGILLADDAHYVHRFHFDHPRGEWVLNDIPRTQGLLRRFEEIWAASAAAVTATTLGL